MKTFYYSIWVDGLIKLKSLPKNRSMWKFYGCLFISMAMAMNIALILAVLQRNILHKSFYHLNIDLFPGTKLDAFVSFFILYLSFPLFLNYFLIFRNNRYEKLFKRYKYREGKLCISYLMVSYFLPFVLLFLAYVIQKI